MKSMYIGSGDVKLLLAGKNTKTHASLMQRFVSDEIPYYNALASPINALRTGAILEERYFQILPDNYYQQYHVICKEMDVLKSSIDFAKLENGKVIDFDELKTSNFDDFLLIKKAHLENDFDFIQKKYKDNYRQVQHQLLCTGLDSANLVFLSVYEYDDELNIVRNIEENDFVKFRIKRDQKVIDEIKERAKIFQTIKDYYND